MPDLVARIKSALADVNEPPWFPSLTAALVQAKWQELSHTTGLTPSNYGTSRFLLADRDASREIAMHLPVSLDSGIETVAVELLTADLLRQYESAGVSFYSGEEIARTPVLNCLKDAFAILSLVPSLHFSVATLVRALHVIKPANEDYDVSFSEPHIPFSIFVSVPERRVQTDELRVAEAIVHEAMHLQLTLIEQAVPLVGLNGEMFFSPWRGEYRTAQGVLHALYVFRVIDAFGRELMLRNALPNESLGHIKDRRSEIAGQIQVFTSLKYCLDSSSAGTCLINRLLS